MNISNHYQLKHFIPYLGSPPDLWGHHQQQPQLRDHGQRFCKGKCKGTGKVIAPANHLPPFAWLTALRFQLRETKSWENVKTKSYNREYLSYYQVPEWESSLEEALKPFLPEEERQYILSTKNRATQIVALQSSQLKELNAGGRLSDYNYVALENRLAELYDQQGKCERIKNFPYPRQFSSINLYFTNVLCVLLPLGFIGEFSKPAEKLGDPVIWLTIPFSVLVGWVFLVLEQIGESTENPLTQISRNIEIDLREMLGETDLPPALQAKNNIIL